MPSAIESQNNPALQGLGLFLFAFPCPPLEDQRKGIRKTSSVNSVPLMRDLSGRSSQSEARSEWAVKPNIKCTKFCMKFGKGVFDVN